MAQTKPKASQFYGVSGNGTAGQVLISDGNGGMAWGSNTEEFTVSWNTPTGQGLTYTQPSPQSSAGTAGSAFPTTTFTVTKSDTIISGTATIAGLPTGVTATQVITGSSMGNTLTVTLSGVFPGVDSLNTDLTLSGLILLQTVSWATPTGQSLTYTQPSPQSSQGGSGTTFPATTFTATPASGGTITGTATITGLPTGITATQSLNNSNPNNILTVTLGGVYPSTNSLNTNLTISGLTITVPLTVNYLVVAGGGGGGSEYAAGGGAGGLRTSFGTISPITISGGSMESSMTLLVSTNYTVSVGGGGAGRIAASGSGAGSNGTNSRFVDLISTGGGGGGNNNGSDGGSGGGAGCSGGTGVIGNAVTSPVVQGFNGGNRGSYTPKYPTGGGGGAAEVGESAPNQNTSGDGGDGLEINILGGTGNFYAGGGGGGGQSGVNAGAGGSSIGGNGTGNTVGDNATPSTGSGGGGAGSNSGRGGGNGSGGIVILRYPDSYTISGLSGTTTTVGTDSVTTFTTGTGNIQFN